ncbi:MAG: hypothetical protein A2104_03515 [Candidatus Melainabacteria bacterium GWF2_32_7]|nr:MAG: hypothetical protein A2104_03515 [Candidatus Melainabacteria bacterium GWF2_32_7]
MNIKKFLLSDNSYKVYLVTAILFGIWFRLYGLDIQSFWFDELGTAAVASYPKLTSIIGYCLMLDVHPPLYHIFTYYWVKMFDNSEILFRLPSAIAGIITIFLMYFGVKKLFNKYIATSATILIALSGSAVYYSQEARSYSILLLFSTILTLLWLDILGKIRESELQVGKLAIYGIMSIVISYLHYFGVALIFFQLIYLIFTALLFKNNFKKVFLLSFIIALFFMPWLLYHFIYIKDKTGGNFWIANQGIVFFMEFLNFVFNKYLIGLIFIPFLINLKSFSKIFLDYKKWLKLDSATLSLSYLSFFPILIFFLISVHTPILIPRYLIILLPSIYLLIAILISLNPGFKEIKGNIYIFIISLLGIIAFLSPINGNGYKFYYDLYKQNWRSASNYIISNLADNSIILVNKFPPTYSYYFDKFNKDKKSLMIRSLRDPDMRYFNIREIYDKAFFAVEVELDKPLEEQLEKDCKVYKKIPFAGGLFVYECRFNNKTLRNLHQSQE